MATPEQAQQVLSNPAFEEAFESLASDLIQNMLSSDKPEDVWFAKEKHNLLFTLKAELESRLETAGGTYLKRKPRG